MQTSRLEFGSLYLARFATSLGAIAVYTLLGTYVEVLGAEGIVVGLFTTSLTLTQTVAVVPIAWAGDRFDKRLLLLGAVALSIATYLGFAPGGLDSRVHRDSRPPGGRTRRHGHALARPRGTARGHH